MEQQFLFIVLAIASRLYKWTTMSHLSTQAWEDGWTWSQENFQYPNGIFSEHWQKTTKTREGYCSVIEANLIIEIEAWLEKSVFRFKVEKFERRMNSNFEQQNQILILEQNAWPGLTVNVNEICTLPTNAKEQKTTRSTQNKLAQETDWCLDLNVQQIFLQAFCGMTLVVF